MGASAWSYFTSYQDNVQKALDELRQKMFNEGQYYRPDSNIPDTFEEWKRLYDIEVSEDNFKSYEDEFNLIMRTSKIVPNSIEELFELNQESGTHSIIDILDISDSTDEDESGTIAVKELIKLFGTEKPNHEMVEAKVNDLLVFRGRWFCTYIVVYRDNKPDELYFTGYSGD